MFDEYQEISLSSLVSGWMFRKGNDSTWAQPNIDLKDWSKTDMTEFSPIAADSKGRIEGW